MGIIDAAKQWLFSIALKKGLTKAAQVGLGALAVWLAGHDSDLKKAGVNINLDTAAIMAAIVGGLDVLRNYLKVKKGWTWVP